MGCISSKVVTRSKSFRDELSQSLQRRINGFPMLEDVIISKNGGDQFLALVCAANTVAKKLQTEPPTTESDTSLNPSLEPTRPETINTWELMEDLEEQDEQAKERVQKKRSQGEPYNRALLRSRSFHTVEEYDAMVLAARNRWVGSGSTDRIEDLTKKVNGLHQRSRSFHTVGEYDRMAMVAGNHLLQAEREARTRDSRENLRLHSNTEVEGRDQPTIKDKNMIGESKVSEASTSFKNSEISDTTSVDVSESSSSSCEPRTHNESIAQEGNSPTGKGFRRKAMAKELSSLDIPVTVEFQRIASLGEWAKQDGQVFSSAEYVTPKFGSFGLPMDTGSDDTVFDPELVAAFEEAMEMLTVEEECILSQIVGDLEQKVKEEGEEAKSDHTHQ